MMLPWAMLAALVLLTVSAAQAQLKALSTTAAFSALNAGSATVATSSTYVGNTSSSIITTSGISQTEVVRAQKHDKKWVVNFGIPGQIAVDYAYLRARMISAYEEDPGVYARGSAALKEAVDILGWTPFSTISSWAAVRCQLQYRFLPPALEEKDGYAFRYSPRFDPASAPVRATTTFWVR